MQKNSTIIKQEIQVHMEKKKYYDSFHHHINLQALTVSATMIQTSLFFPDFHKLWNEVHSEKTLH